MAFRKKFGKKRVFAKKRRVVKKKRLGQSMKKAVKAILYRALETKDKQLAVSSYPIKNASAAAAWDSTIIPMSPFAAHIQIDQGTGNGGRVGNKIETKRLTFKGSLTTTGYDVTTNPNPQPLVIKMWFFYQKDDNAQITSPRLDMFDNGNASIAMSGLLGDTWRSYNTEKYAFVASREFKLGFADYSGTGVAVGNQSFANNDFKLYQKFSIDLTKHCPKHVTFNDTNASPTSRVLLMAVEAVYASNGLIAATTVPAVISYEIAYSYKDA